MRKLNRSFAYDVVKLVFSYVFAGNKKEGAVPMMW